MQPKMQAVHFLPRCVLLLSVCAAFTATTTHAQVVDTEPRSITVVENQENVELHCRIGRPAQLCLIRMPGLNDQIALSPTEKSPVAGYHYHGEGLDKGSCGVRIDRVTADNAGLMNCTLFVDGRGLTGSIEIVVAFPPQQPVIEVVQGNLANVEVNSQLMFRCTAERGNPAANLSWFLDQEQIYEGVQFPEVPEEYYDERSNKHMFTATSTLKRAVRAEDNGKRLTCQAQHLAYPEGVSRTDLILDVNFQPQALPDQVVYGLQLGRTATASMVIKANPSPHVMWNIDGTDYHQGTEQGRYAVPIPEALGNNRYNVSLTIAGLTLEDLSKTYVLRASNNFGVEEYRLTLRSQDEVFSESSSFGTGEIVGLVLAVVIVLLAVALIVGARATGRWCFRGKNSSTSTSAAKIGETSDTESAEVKQPMTKTQRLKNIFAKRLQRGGGAGTNELPEEIVTTPDVAAVDEQDTKPSDGAGKPTKDDQTLVYAELELKPAAGEISFVNKPPAAVSNESTEYAEIMYIQQQANATAGSEATQQQQQQQQPQQQPQQRHHSSEDNRPVIDVSIQKPSAKGDGGKAPPAGGK
ncbi:fasciclin-3 isoform X1 [Anopheles gambiae]|uniref:fasciclin-3 isoform X1 n=1 Tax=Anopheles gambiae TaxID=7165 RepID=UPI002AC8C226|nr:fasciclin-3 isoform X1 [Anopheles gambiae]XP_061513766.1 fasciclin-3 isoform X1 [Anopheles gambiae]